MFLDVNIEKCKTQINLKRDILISSVHLLLEQF